jgi:hypothetical protein
VVLHVSELLGRAVQGLQRDEGAVIGVDASHNFSVLLDDVDQPFWLGSGVFACEAPCPHFCEHCAS